MAKQIKLIQSSGVIVDSDSSGILRGVTAYTVPSGRIAKITPFLLQVNLQLGNWASATYQAPNLSYQQYHNYQAGITIAAGDPWYAFVTTAAAGDVWGSSARVFSSIYQDGANLLPFANEGTTKWYAGYTGASSNVQQLQVAPGTFFLNAGESIALYAKPMNGYSVPYYYRFLVVEEY